MKKFLLISSIILLDLIIANGQNNKSNQQIIEEILELIAETNSDNLNYNELIEDLEYILENPINLNTASTSDLTKLPFLNDFQIASIIKYQRRNGNIVSIYELQLIEGFDINTIKNLIPFIEIKNEQVQDKWNIKNALKYGRHEILARSQGLVEKPSGYKAISDSLKKEKPNNYYLGNRLRLYVKYKFNYKQKIKWGITAEKDPGEKFNLENKQPGFDYLSAHIQINDLGILKKTVIGDYNAQFGQGLIIWSGFTNSKTASVINIRKHGKGLNKYSSTNENNFFRGVGTTIELGSFEISTFGSYKKIDANLINIDKKTFVLSTPNTGIHATNSQLNRRKNMNEMVGGTNIKYHNNLFNISLNALAYKFEYKRNIKTTPAKKFDFNKKDNLNASADFQVNFKKIMFFGEGAIDKKGSTAVLAGALMKFSAQLNVSLLYRDYKKDFHAYYSGGFSEGPGVKNERGFYLGTEIHPYQKWKISAYYDFYRFPWLTYNASAPSNGYDYLVQTDYTISNNFNAYLRFKRKVREENSHNEIKTNPLSKLSETDTYYIRLHTNFMINSSWSLRNRLEISNYSSNKKDYEHGFLLYQDVICTPFKIPLNFVFRYALFDTESYNTRIYTYESDVLNAFSIPALSGQGVRTYLMLRYKMSDSLSFWLRYARTNFRNIESIGTSLNQIDGNIKSEVKLQLRWKI